MMTNWDGRERRNNECCDGNLKAEVAALQVWRETHTDKLTELTVELKATNVNLSALVQKMTEVQTTQKVTHAVAGAIGSVLGLIGGHMWPK